MLTSMKNLLLLFSCTIFILFCTSCSNDSEEQIIGTEALYPDVKIEPYISPEFQQLIDIWNTKEVLAEEEIEPLVEILTKIDHFSLTQPLL